MCNIVTNLMGQDGKPIIVFGTGKLAISVAKFEDENHAREIVIEEVDKPGTVGELYKDSIGKSTDEINTLVRLQFLTVESAQVLFDALEHIISNWPYSFKVQQPD